MQKLQEMFLGKEIRMRTFRAKVLDISEAGWILEITYEGSCLDSRYAIGNIVFVTHSGAAGAVLMGTGLAK